MNCEDMKQYKCFFQLSYEGKSLDSHQMSVEVLAPSLLALGKLVSIANEKANNGDFKADLAVTANFKPGSFLVDLVLTQDLGSIIASLTAPGISATLNAYGVLCLIRDVISIKKFLKGKKPERLVHKDNQTIEVFANNSSVTINLIAYNIYTKEDVVKTCEQFAAPLQKEGIDKISITYEADELIGVSSEELPDFLAKGEDEPISESVRQTALHLDTISFRKDLKWKVTNGTSVIYVSIEDSDFLMRIESGQEKFGKYDIFIVDLAERQFLREGKMITENSILKVKEHRAAPIQSELSI